MELAQIEAQTSLGERFDLREFHAAVLSSGAVPLDVMEQNVRDWMTRKADEKR